MLETRFYFEHTLTDACPETESGTILSVDTECSFYNLVSKALKLAWVESVGLEELNHTSEDPSIIFIGNMLCERLALPETR